MVYDTWQSGTTTPRDVYGQIIDSSGVEVGDRVLLAESTYNNSDPEVSSTADGGFILTRSESNNKLVVGKYNAGLSLENEIEINKGGTDRDTSIGGTPYDHDIATLENGNKVICWRSGVPGSDGSINVQIVNSNGQAVGDAIVVFSKAPMTIMIDTALLPSSDKPVRWWVFSCWRKMVRKSSL